MRTLVSAPHQSRFAAIDQLARSVIEAPAGPDGAPCVHAGLEHVDGCHVLVARTCDEAQTTRLLLSETDPQQLQAALSYLTQRLQAIGLTVVSDQAQLELVH